MREMPAMVRNDVDDLGTLEIALIENLQREDLTALEEARIYFRMLQELDYTQDQLSKTLSKSQQYINDRLQLLHLSPSVQESIQENRLSLSKARKIATIKDRDLQEKVSEKVLRDGLNARQTEQLVKSTKKSSPEHKPKKKVNMVMRFALLKSAVCSLLDPEEIKQLHQNDKRKLIKMLQEFVTELGDVCTKL
jgi:ParB family chromosome partitioning protein